jgi:DNA ligase-associated metallophosphoesterase
LCLRSRVANIESATTPSPTPVSTLPLPLDPPGRSPAGAPTMPLAIAGERVLLHAARALSWPRERTVFVADVHLGKAAAFRAGGVPLPRGSTATDLRKLAELVAQCDAQRLVVLGDFLHAKAGRVAALDAAFVAWRDAHPALDVVLVRGNHDVRAGDPPAAWRVDIVDEPHAFAPFLACHHVVSPRSGYALCGHVHPGVRIVGEDDAARVPCFVVGERRTVLPAFGRFTGLAEATADASDRVIAIAGRALFELPVRR